MQRSSEIIEANEDLLIQILLKLPIKSLFRFKCVSIRWLNLISSHYFSQKHSLRNRKCSPCGLFMHQYPSLLYISLGIIENSRPSFGPVSIHDFLKIPRHYPTHVTTLSFSSGLLLCLLLKPRSEIIHFVINPTTKKSNPLPPLRQLKEKPVINMDLAYDPHESPHYRVVCVRQSSPCDENGLYQFEFLVFSSEMGSNWRICRGPFTNIPPGTRFNEGVYWNNGMHYLSAWEYSGDDENAFYFKFEEETVELLALPPAIRPTKRSWYMGQSCGHLHLVDTQTDIIHGSTVDIYELAIDYSGWVRLYRIDLGAMGYVFPEMVQYVEVDPFVVEGFNNRRVVRRMGRYYSYNVVAVVRIEREEFLEIVLSIPNKIISYNPRSNTTRVLAYFGDDRDRLLYQCTRVVPYISTLSPV